MSNTNFYYTLLSAWASILKISPSYMLRFAFSLGLTRFWKNKQGQIKISLDDKRVPVVLSVWIIRQYVGIDSFPPGSRQFGYGNANCGFLENENRAVGSSYQITRKICGLTDKT